MRADGSVYGLYHYLLDILWEAGLGLWANGRFRSCGPAKHDIGNLCESKILGSCIFGPCQLLSSKLSESAWR